MESVYLQEAFRALDILNEEDFSLSSTEDIKDLKDTIEDDENEMDSLLDVIDPETDEVEELKDNYIGNIILDCQVCHSKFYKDPAEVEIDEETELANIDEECPYCYSIGGYKIIGMVAPYKEEEDIEIETNDEEAGVEEKDIEVDESLVEDLGQDMSEYQKWIDYDMKKYGKISRLTMRKIRDAGLSVTKDQYGDYEVIADRADECLDECDKKPVKEHFEKVEIETDKEKMEMTSDEDGKTVVITEPKEPEEVLEPVSAEVENEIKVVSDENEDEDMIDMDVTDFSEEEFDELGESYLKKVYENVNSFKTSSAKIKDGKLFVEGVIGFASGKQKKTSFIFEGKEITKKGKIKFIGENLQLSKGRKSFTLQGRLNEGKFISESFNYNYRTKDSKGNSTRLYGTVKVK